MIFINITGRSAPFNIIRLMSNSNKIMTSALELCKTNAAYKAVEDHINVSPISKPLMPFRVWIFVYYQLTTIILIIQV